MSKATVAVCGFILGACCAFLLSNRTQIVAASTTNPQTSESNSHRNVFRGGGAFGATTGVLIEGAIPRFIALEEAPIFEDFTISGASNQPLDGLACRNCTFNDTVLTYSGGPYNLEKAQFLGTTRWILKGAAANTFAFLQLMNGISKGVPTASLAPNKPVQRKATAKKVLPKMNFTAPYIGQK